MAMVLQNGLVQYLSLLDKRDTGIGAHYFRRLQPTGREMQCVGAFHPVRKEVLFLYGGVVSLYSLADGSSSGSVEINWGKSW